MQGKAPAAKGKLGDILGLAKEEENSQEIAEVGIFTVDGENYLPDTWYDVRGKSLGGMEYAKETVADSLST